MRRHGGTPSALRRATRGLDVASCCSPVFGSAGCTTVSVGQLSRWLDLGVCIDIPGLQVVVDRDSRVPPRDEGKRSDKADDHPKVDVGAGDFVIADAKHDDAKIV